MKKWLTLVFVIAAALIAPWIGSFAATRLQGTLRFIDPDKVFSWGVIHHVVQMIIPLVVMLLWPGRPLSEWGFRTGNKKKGMRWVLWFSLAWCGIYVVLTAINVMQKRVPQVYYDVTDARNLAGELVFRGLIVGISEETLFRAFPITLLAFYWGKKYKAAGVRISRAGVIAAVIFCLAHVNLGFSPLAVNYNLIQLITALGLGLLYAVVFEDTRSVYYPAIIHGVSDVVPVLSLFVIHLLVNG